MLYARLILIAFQHPGDLIADAASLPTLGVVIGLLLPLSALALRGWWLGSGATISDPMSRVSQGLHDHSGLLFVRTSAGIVDNFDRRAAERSVISDSDVVGAAQRRRGDGIARLADVV